MTWSPAPLVRPAGAPDDDRAQHPSFNLPARSQCPMAWIWKLRNPEPMSFVPLDQVVEDVADLVAEAYELFDSRTDGVLKVLLLP
jgi:hypothetical protein